MAERVTINNNARLLKLCNWNDSNLKSSRRINWRASLVPAAAVIPAPKGYINVVAVKKLVVEFREGCRWSLSFARGFSFGRPSFCGLYLAWLFTQPGKVPLSHWEQIGVLKAGLIALNILAWNDKIWLLFYFVGYGMEVMINRNSAGVLVLKGQRWNSWILSRRTTAKAFTKDVFINQERKLGDPKRSDTFVVLTVNYAD